MVNFHYWTRRLLGRATCIKGASTRIMAGARVINIRGTSEAITLGKNTVIRGDLVTFGHGGSIEIGDWCFVGEGARVWSSASIRIGNRVMIAHNVNVFDNLTHPLDPSIRHDHFRQIIGLGHPRAIDLGESPVRIDDDAWVAAGAMVLRGVHVGEGAIVAAGAVVTHDVPPYTIVAGNPATIVRNIEHLRMPRSSDDRP